MSGPHLPPADNRRIMYRMDSYGPSSPVQALLRVCEVIESHHAQFVPFGISLDEKYSHHRCWLHAVEYTNQMRVQAPRNDSAGNPILPLSDSQVSALWQRWETALRTGQPMKGNESTGPRDYSTWEDRYRMPLPNESRYATGHARARQFALPELMGQLSDQRWAIPSLTDSAHLVILIWALHTTRSQQGGVALTDFQKWRDDIHYSSPMAPILACPTAEPLEGFDSLSADAVFDLLAGQEAGRLLSALCLALEVVGSRLAKKARPSVETGRKKPGPTSKHPETEERCIEARLGYLGQKDRPNKLSFARYEEEHGYFPNSVERGRQLLKQERNSEPE